MAKQSTPGFLHKLSAPARRALENEGITSLQQLAKLSEAEVLQLHGMGKASLPTLREALSERSLSFRETTKNKTNKAANIDEYVKGFPKSTQQKLEQVRAQIRKTAPRAEECISYGIPAFKLDGYQLVYFAGYKKHIGLYPAPVNSEAFKEELSRYKTGRGSVQFPLDQQMPLDLVARIVQFRAKVNEARIKTLKAQPTIVVPSKTGKASEGEKVLAYFNNLDKRIATDVQAVRKLIQKTIPKLEERIKWNAPSYHYKGMDLLTFGPQKEKKLLLIFHHPAIVKIQSALLEGTYKDRRLMYFTGKEAISRNKKELERILTEFTGLAGVPV
jgi:uncharacterized protein YdhG (YjbR/CyaY superfamily)